MDVLFVISRLCIKLHRHRISLTAADNAVYSVIGEVQLKDITCACIDGLTRIARPHGCFTKGAPGRAEDGVLLWTV
jgi:hypothetical protein